METIIIIIKTMIVGILGSLPVGPIVIMTLQRSLRDGQAAGMACSVGAIISDTIFATFALFAYGLVSNLLSDYEALIEMIGGSIIIIVGISMLFSRRTISHQKIRTDKLLLDTGRSLLVSLTNPGPFLWILAAFTALNLDPGDISFSQSIAAVGGVFAGSLMYWLNFTWIAAKGRKKISVETLIKVNRISGIAIIGFGIFLILKPLVLV